MPERTPNPGSREAHEMGCTCAAVDNNHGAGIGNGQFVYRVGCPVHARSAVERVDESRRQRERELGASA